MDGITGERYQAYYMRQDSISTREGKYSQDGRSARYAVRDGDSAND